MVIETDESVNERRFSESSSPPPLALRSDLSPVVAAPAYLSEVGGYEATAHEFERGQNALGHKEIHPQQWAVQQVVDSTNEDGSIRYAFVSVNVPRRSGKSESITGLAVGRCLSRPGYRVAVTFATTGTKLSSRWKQDYFDRLTAWAEIHNEVLTPVLSNGHEALRFGNGSLILLLPPRGSAFRSEAFDLVIVDEAGEADKVLTETLLESILPTLDTREDAQVIVAGTPPEFRAGNLLWTWENIARQGEDPDYGAVLYGVPWDLTLEDLETWEDVEPLVTAHHPGVGTLTKIENMRRNYNAMGPAKFAREYLGQAGRDEATAGVINPAKWKACEADTDLPDLPEHFAVAASVGVGDAFGALAVAWRDDNGVAVVGLLEYKTGSSWLPAAFNDLATKYPRIPIGADQKGTAAVEADKATRERSRTVIQRRTWTQVQQDAALFVREVHTGNLVHFGQEPLTEAALIASRRGEEKAFAFGRPNSNAQIAAVEAASLALGLYDATPAKSAMSFTFV